MPVKVTVIHRENRNQAHLVNVNVGGEKRYCVGSFLFTFVCFLAVHRVHRDSSKKKVLWWQRQWLGVNVLV